MTLTKRHSTFAMAGVAALALVLSGCSSAGGNQSAEEQQSEQVDQAVEDTASAECAYPVTVTDMAGNEVTIESADSVAVTDNRTFAVLNEWGVQPTAAPRTLMSPHNSWAEDETILDTGSHAEPNFDQVIAAEPTVIINGYRYRDHAEKMQEAAPDAALVAMDNADLSPDEYAIAQVTLLGEVFCKQDEAAALIDQFHTAVEDAKAAYDPAMTVMGLVTNANEIRYSNPADGRGASIFFNLLDLTPALDAEGSTNHQGDDISIEAIAESNPGFFLVLDRDAAVTSDGETTPALELINGSTALAGVPAVQNQAIYVMPADYYLTEDIYAYIDVLGGLQQAFTEHK